MKGSEYCKIYNNFVKAGCVRFVQNICVKMQVCKKRKRNNFLFGFTSVISCIFPPYCEKLAKNGT